MNTDFQLIVITPEQPHVEESKIIGQLFEYGLHRLHIRKPAYSVLEMRRYIEALPWEYYSRLVLHDHHDLALQYCLGGIHLNRRYPDRDERFAGSVSRSCHTLAEVKDKDYDYCFLSPIFDSVSKSGYQAAFTDDELTVAHRSGIITPRVIALGGITSDHLPQVRKWGFGGAALLGWIWNSSNPAEQFSLVTKSITRSPHHPINGSPIRQLTASPNKQII